MPDDKTKVSIRIPNSMLESVRLIGYTNTTEAMVKGLELLIKTNECQTDVLQLPDNARQVSDKDIDDDSRELRARIEEKDIQISDKNIEIEFLKGQITIKDQQITIKDQQIDKRDADIKNLVAITTTQTYKAH
jgi:hypothetical protein